MSILCGHQILCYWSTQREIQEMWFFTAHNFCKERTYWILASGAKKPGYVTSCMYVWTWFELCIEYSTGPTYEQYNMHGMTLVWQKE